MKPLKHLYLYFQDGQRLALRFHKQSEDPAAVVKKLAEAKIITDARPGHVRVSPYFYNVPDDHRALLEHLAP